tara:strand:+ start:1357 stop:2073 length:717 start_codon:yes stop_codon:yes gene_type:complete
MNNFFIIGGGLTGLSCAFKLIQLEINPSNIFISEARQEIGSPSRSPGIGINSDNFKKIIETIKIQHLAKLNFKNNYVTFRREWFEKSILIYLTNLGCNINLKKRINNNTLKNLNETIIINCAGKKPKGSGFPADFKDFKDFKDIISNNEDFKLIPWYGFLSINSNINNNNNTISIKKEEDFFETWSSEKNYVDFENENIIELMNSYFPSNIENIFANKTIDRGFSLANKAVKKQRQKQ